MSNVRTQGRYEAGNLGGNSIRTAAIQGESRWEKALVPCSLCRLCEVLIASDDLEIKLLRGS
jgi:hypothetical protein